MRRSAADNQRWDRDRDRDRDGDRFRGSDRRDDRRDWDQGRDRGWSRYRYYHAPSSAYRNWDRQRTYTWNNYRYRYFGDSWVIIDPGYDYVETTTVPSTLSVTGDLVRDVQVELARAGYNPGPADGLIGQGTRNAIAQFQADRGMSVTGRIDEPLLNTLGLL